MKIRKLLREEHEKTRRLWEQIFTEDSKAFLDYYYSVKTVENEIYVAEEAGEICAMLHLNPYRLHVGMKECAGNYIVAVATDKNYRHRGLMSSLLEKSMQEMYERREPFTFLMPAAEAIYRPFDFRFVYRQRYGDIQGKAEKSEILIKQIKPEMLAPLAAFANEQMEGRFDVYTKRDSHYYEMALKEQESENGGILAAENEDGIVGSFFYAKEERFEIREPLLRDGFAHVLPEMIGFLTKNEKETVRCLAWGEEEKPLIMVRILHLESLLKSMRAEEKMRVCVSVKDPMMQGNHDTFLICGDERGLRAERTKERADGEITIAALTSFLFGYQTLEEIEEAENLSLSGELKRELQKIHVLRNIFLNEVV